jgi:hypothetical protein
MTGGPASPVVLKEFFCYQFITVLIVHSVNASLYDNSLNCFRWFVRHVVSGAIAKMRKATVSFVMAVRSSVCPSVHMEQLSSHWMYFHEI